MLNKQLLDTFGSQQVTCLPIEILETVQKKAQRLSPERRLRVPAWESAGRLPRGYDEDWRTTRRVGICHSLRAALGLSSSMPARKASIAAAARWLHDICTVLNGGSMNCAR